MANDLNNTEVEIFINDYLKLKSKFNKAQKALLRMANPTNGDELKLFPETIAQEAIDEISQI